MVRDRGGGFVELIDQGAHLVVGFQTALEGAGLRAFEETEDVK
jgi:hypothetical protein